VSIFLATHSFFFAHNKWNSYVWLPMFDDKFTGIKKGLMAVFGI
jgi:hypothetical protein